MAASYTADCLTESAALRDDSLLRGRLGSALAFLIPALQFLRIHVVGWLFMPDLLLVALLPFALLSDGHILLKKLPRTFLVLGVAWLASQVATDLIRSTSFHDYARGWAMIAFTLAEFATIYVLLYSETRRIALYTLGVAAGGILTYFLNPFYAPGNPWKFGYGFGVTLLIVLVATLAGSRGRSLVGAVIMSAAGALNLYNGYRSQAGWCLLTAIYLVLQRLTRRRYERGVRPSSGSVFFTLAVLAMSAVAILRFYGYCASSGMLGYRARSSYEMESAGSYGVLVGGRPDFLVGLEAALQSPIIGYGSWPQEWQYEGRTNSVMASLGYEPSTIYESWIIPSHSYLIGAWVSAGILGAAFWLWLLSVPLRVLARLYATAEPLTPLLMFFAAALIWNCFFSPYGADQRLIVSFYSVALMSFLETYSAPVTLF